jgi:hypothetical protein
MWRVLTLLLLLLSVAGCETHDEYVPYQGVNTADFLGRDPIGPPPSEAPRRHDYFASERRLDQRMKEIDIQYRMDQLERQIETERRLRTETFPRERREMYGW